MASNSSQRRIRFDDLGEDYEGRVTDDAGNPFTGICYEEHPISKRVVSETEYVDGLKHGIERRCNADGNLESEGHFWQGMAHGDDRYWYQNGQLRIWIHWELSHEVERMDWSEDGVLMQHRTLTPEEQSSLERARQRFGNPESPRPAL